MIDQDRLLVLDTHAWFWLAVGDPEFTRQEQLKSVVDELWRYDLNISAITPWEISMLESKQRIILKQDCLSWLTQSVHQTHVRILELTLEVSVSANRLPGDFHGDPADRMIVATTRLINGVLLTRDSKILEYGKGGFVDTLEI